MPFWKCYYHIIWATKNREAVITPPIEMVVFETIRTRADELNSPILAINGTADHVHVAVCVPPSLAVGDWMKQIKGASSRSINMAFDNLPAKFRWQEGYGVLTFGAKNSSFVVRYIENQKEHHQTGDLQPYLEQLDE